MITMASWMCIIPLCILVIDITPVHGDNCQHRSSNSSSLCACCSSGYDGYNCTDICPNCESHLLSENRCMELCKVGYYGPNCNTNCSAYCKKGNYGPPVCRREDGCCENGCISGRYGMQCDSICNRSCQDMKCIQKDGSCINCISNRYGRFCNISCSPGCYIGTCTRDGICIGGCKDNNYGKHCNISCSPGCYNGTCTREGICIDGCKDTHYGARCESACGTNCKNLLCIADASTGFTCTNGCETGYTSRPCDTKCPDYCQECEQNNGSCISCMENTDTHCHNGDCVKGQVSCKPKPGFDHKWLLLLSTLPCGVILFRVIVICRKKRNCHNCSKYEDDQTHAEDTELAQLLSDKSEENNWTDDINAVERFMIRKILSSSLETNRFQVFPRTVDNYLTQNHAALMARLRELPGRKITVVIATRSLLAVIGLGDAENNPAPKTFLCDVCVFSPTAPALVLTITSAKEKTDELTTYSSNVARRIEQAVSRKAKYTFSAVYGVVTKEVCLSCEKFKKAMNEMLSDAYETSSISALVMNSSKCHDTIQLFLDLLPEDKENKNVVIARTDFNVLMKWIQWRDEDEAVRNLHFMHCARSWTSWLP